MKKQPSRNLNLAGYNGGFPKTVAVFRALQLGDLLCAVPAFRALRHAWPKATIALVGLPWAASFVTRFRNYFDSFQEFPGWEGIPECGYDPARMERFRRSRTSHDLVIQLHGNGSVTNQFLPLLGPRFMAGFFARGQPCPDRARFIPYPEGEHEIRRLLQLLEHLGIPLKGEHLEFPLSPADEREAAELQEAGKLPTGQFVCLHVGARDPRRRWPIEKFLEVGKGLVARGFRVVLTGTAEEAGQAGWLAERLGRG
ncbi:MAG: lipopolysaccharide heptosyltransferase family protein, partial [Acidobacteria bacterium]